MDIKKYFVLFLSFMLLSACSKKEFEKLRAGSNNYKITTEKELTENITIDKIDAFFYAGVEGTFVGRRNVKIYYKYFLQKPLAKEKGAILISSGRAESVIKYKELIYDLFQNGYSVYIHDHRGHGFSGRIISNRGMGFVNYFQKYIDDMKQFYDTILLPNNHKQKYLLAHSMGGAIATIYLKQYPNDFMGAAFISPMLGFSFAICELAQLFLTDGTPKYAFGNKNYDDGVEPFEANYFTNSEVRYNRMLEVFEKYPNAKLGGATYKWIYEVCNAIERIFNNYDKIKTPLIIFSGSKEEVVNPSAHNKFVEKLINNKQNAKGYLVEGAKHKMLIEKDEYRIPVLNKILDFYSSIKQ